MLISETHFTNKYFLKIHGYKLYHTQHPSGRAHGGRGELSSNPLRNTISSHRSNQTTSKEGMWR